MPPERSGITLGILAGGRATRLDGRDKAWLQRGGEPQVLRLRRRLQAGTQATLVSANRQLARYQTHGLACVPDRHPDCGPLGGLHALAQATTTPWLFTVPVDVVDVNDCLLRTLLAAGGQGAFAVDDEGVQPLVALWPVAGLRVAAQDAIASGELGVQALQRTLGLQAVRFSGFRFGNLNTPADLAAVGIGPDPDHPASTAAPG